MKNGTRLWREAHFQVKMHKTPQGGPKHICQSKCTKHHTVGAIFCRSDVQKWHAAVARSTFVSQNAQTTTCSDQFWKVRCPKMVRRCGAKRICKSKCTKHLIAGPILLVQMSKNGTPLWREAHLQVKMRKTPHSRATF